MLFFLNPFAPHPQSVRDDKQRQWQHEPEQYVGRLSGILVLLLQYGRLVREPPALQQLFGGQVVVTPFAHYHAVFQQHQSGITAYDGLQGDVVRVAERIFRPRDVGPSGYRLASAGRQTVEVVAVITGVFIYLVYVPEH